MLQRFFGNPVVQIVAILVLAGLAGLGAHAGYNLWWIAVVLAGLIGIGGLLEWAYEQGLLLAVRQRIPVDFHAPITLRRIPAVVPQRGYLDFRQRHEDAVRQTKLLEQRIIALVTKFSLKFIAGAAMPVDVLAPAKDELNKVARYSKNIDSLARHLEGVEGQFRRSVNELRSELHGLLETMPLLGIPWHWSEWAENSKVEETNHRAGRKTIGDFRDIVQRTGATRISASFMKANDRLLAVVDKLAVDYDALVEYFVEAQVVPQAQAAAPAETPKTAVIQAARRSPRSSRRDR